MKLALAVAVACALVRAQAATADPCQGVYNPSSCHPAPWNGQLQDTWNMPGTYGGWVNTPIICDPQTTRCTTFAQP